MFLDGYILGIFGTVIGTITTELSFTPLWKGLIVASSLLGILVGSPVGGWLRRQVGRKPLFMIDMGIFVICPPVQ
jgi:MFS transporter, putative metabolite transport protein